MKEGEPKPISTHVFPSLTGPVMLPSTSSMVWEAMHSVWVELSGGRKTALLPWQREETATEGVGTGRSTALSQYLALRTSSVL